MTKRTLTWTVASLLLTSPAFAQGGRTVGDMPVASANPPQGAIAVMPSQDRSTSTRTMGVGAVTTRRPEDYGGVSPGAREIPRGLRRLAARRGAGLVVAWPGFQMLPNGSRIFIVGTVGTAIVEGARGPGVRSYFFPGARLHLHNNGRPLETALFATPLVRARLRSVRGGVALHMELRADVTPVVSQEPAAQGLVFHYLSFPAYSTSAIATIRLPNGLEVLATPQGPAIAPTAPPAR